MPFRTFQIFSYLEHPSYFYTQGCGTADCLKIVCQVGHLERGKSAILYLKSRLWTQTFMNVSDWEYFVIFSEALKVIFVPTCNTNFVFLSQKENQNHSYSLKSSASFSVIEFPYKNLSFEDIHNSTVVSHLHPAWVTIYNHFTINAKTVIVE